jgi:hypothetical protein
MRFGRCDSADGEADPAVPDARRAAEDVRGSGEGAFSRYRAMPMLKPM